ncbi:DENN domain-containing protein 2C isoform X1 [Salvelinus sp. IW2-2015]|uniref:DENN domain-containing protein 2C isoform X1 n=1 Tax=Salvelinus sp. IW2-2015 TaxID=2691554 RepID=UPI000CDFE052|nr:DENN domain-containing protein 2C isoform X1 [Salvelinus alpinus]
MLVLGIEQGKGGGGRGRATVAWQAPSSVKSLTQDPGRPTVAWQAPSGKPLTQDPGRPIVAWQAPSGEPLIQDPSRPTLAWQAPSGKPLTQDLGRPGLNIRQKISQWEGLCQPNGDGQAERVKAHAPVVSRSLSGDVLGNGVCSDSLGGGPHGKANLSKARSLGLDFRENLQARCGHKGIGRKSDAPQNHSYFSKTSTTTPVSKPFTAPSQTLTTDTTDIFQVERIIPTNGELKVGNVLEVKWTKPLCLSVDDHGESLPPGNFYTSRGFWRRLEGDVLFWEKGRNTSAEPQSVVGPATRPPPKPQRTFQYQGGDSTPANWVQWDSRIPSANQSNTKCSGIAQTPSFPAPLCPVSRGNVFSRHRKNRKSFEFEDVVQLTAQQGTLGSGARRSGLFHAFSDDNIYEDIISGPRDNPYEDVKLSPTMCLPIRRPRPWNMAQRESPCTPKLPPKPLTLRVERKETLAATPPTPTSPTEAPHRTAFPKRPTTTHKTYRLPQYVNKIHVIFDAKRGRKRVKSQAQGGSAREETSGTESDPEDNTNDFLLSPLGGSRRSVYVQSTLKRRPGYRTLERDLIQLQQQQLFQLFVVVSLRKSFPGNTYAPEITQQFPNKFAKSSRHSREAEDRLKAIPKFCFPDSQDWRPSGDLPSETFSFVLTGEDGSRWFCYCRKILPCGKGKRLPEVHCIVSRLGCFNLFAKILEEVERRREICPALVSPFMRSVMEAPFPAPGRTITVKSFLPGSGNEVLTLCRPVDSRLEHVDFESLLQCLSVGRLLQVFASLLLERRVIFIANKLSVLSRCGHAALALLYPFTWQHTFVPVLPASMLDISCSPTPFLMGALAPCLPELLELPIEEVLIVDLCADKFVKQLGDEDCILPSKLQAALQQILEERGQILRQDGDCTGQQCELSSLVSEAFVHFFVELVGHYSLHMGVSGTRELQRESFCKSHPSRGARQFLQLFMDTQMFSGFIHDKELRKGGGKGLFEVRAAEYLASNPESESSGFLKGLKGIGMKFLQKK